MTVPTVVVEVPGAIDSGRLTPRSQRTAQAHCVCITNVAISNLFSARSL